MRKAVSFKKKIRSLILMLVGSLVIVVAGLIRMGKDDFAWVFVLIFLGCLVVLIKTLHDEWTRYIKVRQRLKHI